MKNRTLSARRFPGTPTKFQPIDPITFKVNTPVCVALIESRSAKYNWWSAGFAQAFFYSGAFVNRQLTGFKNWHIGLSRPVLLDFREYEAVQYGLEFTFRPWHRDIRLQVWKYQSDLTDATNIDLQRILADIARVEKKIDDISEYGR
ncbi:hypothetical protein [Rivularia sp. PCC 7116]|uniref:hypothetical protein n=1 Tax=Rivularia sp. PCC 7116 TaxID=373994 RepID=UPI00031778CF|nr:hypothetical protein [Rivularia sp. PCC 7116]